MSAHLEPRKFGLFRKALRLVLFAVSVVGLGVLGCNWWLINSASGLMTRDFNKVAKHDVAIVLGTSPRAGGGANVFFTNRIATAVNLWKAGKVKQFVVSGDNRRKDYDEPTFMRNALMEKGVPESAIVRDYAGLRTLDSMFRASQVFDVKRAIIVTDDWHLPRALFLAKHAGIDAAGVASRDVSWRISPATRIRETLSRVKAVLDIYVLDTKPRFGS
jgi:SanA protein